MTSFSALTGRIPLRQPMEFNQLRYFVAVAESGSFSRAARSLGVTQPTLSQQIARMEQTLGCRVLDRLGRGVVMTDSGRVLLDRAKRILQEADHARRDITTASTRGLGPLSLGAIPSIGPYLLPGAIKELAGRAPEVEVTIREDLTGELIRRVVEGDLDLAVCSGPIEDERVQVTTLGSEPMLVCAPADHPFAQREQIEVSELDEEPVVVIHELHCVGEQVRAFCRSNRLNPRTVCRAGQLCMARNMVAAGVGVSLVPRMAALTEPGVRVVYRPLADQRFERAVTLVSHHARALSSAAQAMVEALRAEWAAMQNAPVDTDPHVRTATRV
ncbi:MAG: LysR family transcriptional regulator [Planctomyces sp.]|nr:LysR family transcriptional regulator [Planctomyces sp.]